MTRRCKLFIVVPAEPWSDVLWDDSRRSVLLSTLWISTQILLNKQGWKEGGRRWKKVNIEFKNDELSPPFSLHTPLNCHLKFCLSHFFAYNCIQWLFTFLPPALSLLLQKLCFPRSLTTPANHVSPFLFFSQPFLPHFCLECQDFLTG